MDSTPPNILDTPFQALVFLSRAEHDALLSQIAVLQGELALVRPQEDAPLDQGLAVKVKQEQENFLASFDAELQQARIDFLEQEKADFLAEKQALLNDRQALGAAVEETNAKARALQSEVSKLRGQLQHQQQQHQQHQQEHQQDQQQQHHQQQHHQQQHHQQQHHQQQQQAHPSATPSRPEEDPHEGDRWKKEKETLEARDRVRISENERLRTQLVEAEKELDELRSIIPEAKKLGENYRSLQTEHDAIVLERQVLKATNHKLEMHHSEILKAQRTLETESQKSRDWYIATLARREQENKELRASHEDLLESKAAVEAEVKALRGDEDRYRQELRARHERLLEEKGAELIRVKEELRAVNTDLRRERDLLRGLRSDHRALADEREGLLRELHKTQGNDRASLALEIQDLKKQNIALLDQIESWRNDYAESRKEVQGLRDRLRRELQRGGEGDRSDAHPATKSPRSAAAEASSDSSLAPLPATAPNEAANPPKDRRSNEPSSSTKAAPSAKRKAVESPLPPSPLPPPPQPLPSSSPSSTRPVMPDGNREKRLKIEQSSQLPLPLPPLPPPPPSSSSSALSLAAAFRKRGAVYLVEVTHPASRSALRTALARLGSEVTGLRRVFYGHAGPPEKWVVKFAGAPKEFVKHICVVGGVFASLSAGVGGTACLICKDGDHDIWDCSFVGAEDQDRPTPKQPETGYRLLPLGVASSPIPLNPPPPADEQSPRSLFERVTFPDGRLPPRRPQPSSQSNSLRAPVALGASLLSLSHTERRVLFCRFSGNYVPKEDQLLAVICGGPVDFVRTVDASRVGFVDFLCPDDAAKFLQYAIAKINGKFKFYERKPGFTDQYSTAEFQWSDTAVKPLDPHIARGVVMEGWSRVLELQTVPESLTVDQICSHVDCEAHKLGFWVEEDVEHVGLDGMRDIRIEFRSIKEAETAFRSLAQQGYPEYGLRFGLEDTRRPVPPME